MDGNTIYVRERGILRRVSGIVLAQSEPASSCRRTNPIVLRKEHFIFTYNAEGSLRYTAKSLFDITLLFVADNIHHVDSLVGFPEQIGEKLFATAEENHAFVNADISTKALQLFSNAYGEKVLGSLCLRNRFPLLHERINDIKTFHSLKSLDLFGCRLGDDHEIFPHLTSSSLSCCLAYLCIGGNSLSDIGLQRLTAPIRMMKKGLDCLQFLDLSHNPISDRAVRYLTCLPKLQKLDLSGTGLKLCSKLKTSMFDLLGLLCSGKPLDTFDHLQCKTQGWAEQVVNQWETNGLQMPKTRKYEESRTSALHFFGRRKFVREVLNAAPVVRESYEEDMGERLQFYKPAADSLASGKWTSTNTHRQDKHCGRGVTKRRDTEKYDHSHQQPAKRKCSPAFSAEDMDLLNSY